MISASINYYLLLMRYIVLSIKVVEVRSVFLDISEAFDKVWHNGIIFKLTQNDILENLLNLFCKFLNEKKTMTSSWRKIFCVEKSQCGQYLKVRLLVFYCCWFTLMICRKAFHPMQNHLQMMRLCSLLYMTFKLWN